MPSAEIITIGTELLLGEIQDTNTRYIARFLRNEGIDLFRTTMIGDNENRITATVMESLSRSDIVITTGGLGPTVDDPTRNAIARSIGTELEFRPELWEQIRQRFERFGRIPTENNKKQAYIPMGAMAIENAVGTAPAFYCRVENGLIISLPGVPKELEYLLENQVKDILRNQFNNKYVIQTYVIHTSGIGESVIDEKIADLETLSNPTVGIVAYPGQTDIRITAKALNKAKATKMISNILNIITQRLGGFIFGFNEDTLDEVIAKLLLSLNLKVCLIENGTDQLVKQLLQKYNILISETENTNIENLESLEKNLENLYKNIYPNILLVTELIKTNDKSASLTINYFHNDQIIRKSFQFGGHDNLSLTWAANTTMHFLRLQLTQN
ncbi:MAG: competence/damage-inducible protein A [Anaerolineaceae bacterium]|nr:competence/damage-inducible protein A [Anaerolineaceae bacterium]